LQGYELDSVMNYPLKEAIISYMQSGNARVLLQAIRTLIDHYPKQTLDCLMNILGTHDTSRILTVLGGIYCRDKDEMASKNAFLSPKNKENALKKLKMAAVLQYTLPGVPCLYYGDENGAEGHIDPFCRTCFDWDNLNEDLIAFYQKLGKIRKEYKEIFKDGDFEEIVCQDGLIIYKRIKDNKSIFVYSNNSSKRYPLKIKKAKELISGESFEELLEIKPQSYGIFVEKKA
jgi:glycosidase